MASYQLPPGLAFAGPDRVITCKEHRLSSTAVLEQIQAALGSTPERHA